MTLKDLKIGDLAVITSVGGKGPLRRHFLDMGIIPGTEVTLIKYAPMGDPIEIKIRGYFLTLRISDAQNIKVIKTRKTNVNKMDVRSISEIDYSFDFRVVDKMPFDKNTRLTFALVGNPNSGKTTLFNKLTGSNQHIGNFPGVTVEKKSGVIKGFKNAFITDLPGIYSLSPYSSEEIISRNFILNQKPSCIINVADATNIERSLYLTLQLIELNIPTVLALNMMDEVHSNGGKIDVKAMQAMLGVPVMAISASKNKGVDELIKCVVYIAEHSLSPKKTDFYLRQYKSSAAYSFINGITNIIKSNAQASGLPIEFAAGKLIEDDKEVKNALNLSKSQRDKIDYIIDDMEYAFGLESEVIIADMRFSFIKALCDTAVLQPKKSKGSVLSQKIDKIFTGKFTAVPAFIIIMTFVFLITFNAAGLRLQEMLQAITDYITSVTDKALTVLNVNSVLHSLVTDGILTGVGSVLSFIPIVLTLFLFFSLLEDSGYMARVAFIMDKPLRKIGLSGKSIVPMLIGFGCSVPAVMASRTLPCERDRKITIMLTPFMSCSAKLPIYAFFTAAFFPEHSGFVILGLYFLGIAAGIVAALILKDTTLKGEGAEFIMELPNYRIPVIKNVALLLWDKIKDFLKRAFTVILIASLAVWCLETFDISFQIVKNPQNSLLSDIAGLIAPIFKLHGFDDWRIVASLATGFLAKENVISTLSVLFGSTDALKIILSPISAISLMVFCLLYTPCVAAIASIRRELGKKWAIGIIIGQCMIAWFFSLVIRAIGILIMGMWC